MTGQAFGRLTVIERSGSFGCGKGRGQAIWRCSCECGGEVSVRRDHLVSGNTRSCGCLMHGISNTAEYQSWAHMRRRCGNPRNNSFHNYGGRGITVCERWQVFENFLADMGARPSALHSIDRIDVNGNYEPGNCRWATAVEQNSNTRRSHFITANGLTKTLAEWSRSSGLGHNTIRCRLARGCPPDVAVSRASKSASFTDEAPIC